MNANIRDFPEDGIRAEHIIGSGPFELCATTRGLSDVMHYFDQPSGTRVYVDDGDWVVVYPDGFKGKLNNAMFERIFGD